MDIPMLRRRLGRALGRDRRWLSERIAREATPPPRPAAQVVMYAMSRADLGGNGKVSPAMYYPFFGQVLRRRNVALRLAFSAKELRRMYGDGIPTVVVCLYKEDAEDHDTPAHADAVAPADLVFNPTDIGRIIGDKHATHAHLAAAGIPMPKLATDATGPILSNAATGSGGAVQIVDGDGELDPSRYNAAFVDTRVPFEGETYYTTLRMLSVGRHVVSVYPRARPVHEGPNVRNKVTPRDPRLLDHLIETQIEPSWERLERLAAELAGVCGASFLGSDLLVEAGTGALHVCEPNFKLNDQHFHNRFADLAPRMRRPCVALSAKATAEASALAFLACCADHGQAWAEADAPRPDALAH